MAREEHDLDHTFDFRIGRHMTKPTPEEIMRDILWKKAPAPNPDFPKNRYHWEHWPPLVSAQIQALTDAGKVIVDRALIEEAVRRIKAMIGGADWEGGGSPLESTYEFLHVLDALLKNTGSGTSAMVTTSDAEWYDPEEPDTGS